MKKVITYGTFDLFHKGHYNILKRAKELGDYLIVGVTSDSYDISRGKLNVNQSLAVRIKNVKDSGFVDEIIVEEYEGQKVNDILKNNIDIFAVGSDWKGKFDYLKEFCEVVYLERTREISSTQIRNIQNGILKIGIVGAGRIAKRFIAESKFVSGLNVEGVYTLNENSCKNFAEQFELNFYTTDYTYLLKNVDAVYIASPHKTHFEYAKEALIAKKHVLCEKPITLSANEAEHLYSIAQESNLVLLEAIKTAYSNAFLDILGKVKTGVIGDIKNLEATFTKLVKEDCRELNIDEFGGSMTELSSYPLLAVIKILGKDIKSMNFYSYYDNVKKVDLFTKSILLYDKAIANINVGLGVKSEGELIISGTKGYIYVPAPWWKTEYFEIRYENPNTNKKVCHNFDGEGLRYEIAEFLYMINNKKTTTYKLLPDESIKIIEIIENYINNTNKVKIN